MLQTKLWEVKVSTHATEAQRRSRVVVVHVLNLIVSWELVFNATPRPLCHQGRASIPVVLEAEPVWPGVQKRKIPCPNRSLITQPSSP